MAKTLVLFHNYIYICLDFLNNVRELAHNIVTGFSEAYCPYRNPLFSLQNKRTISLFFGEQRLLETEIWEHGMNFFLVKVFRTHSVWILELHPDNFIRSYFTTNSCKIYFAKIYNKGIKKTVFTTTGCILQIFFLSLCHIKQKDDGNTRSDKRWQIMGHKI